MRIVWKGGNGSKNVEDAISYSNQGSEMCRHMKISFDVWSWSYMGYWCSSDSDSDDSPNRFSKEIIQCFYILCQVTSSPIWSVPASIRPLSGRLCFCVYWTHSTFPPCYVPMYVHIIPNATMCCHFLSALFTICLDHSEQQMNFIEWTNQTASRTSDGKCSPK